MRRQQTAPKAEVVGWEQGEYGVVKHLRHGWRGYAVDFRDKAYAELERIQEEGRAKRQASRNARH